MEWLKRKYLIIISIIILLLGAGFIIKHKMVYTLQCKISLMNYSDFNDAENVILHINLLTHKVETLAPVFVLMKSEYEKCEITKHKIECSYTDKLPEITLDLFQQTDKMRIREDYLTINRYTQEVEYSHLSHLEGVHRKPLFYKGTCERTTQKF